MTSNEFCYWLQGRAELLPDQPPTDAEWKMIREHLALVFTKVTPPKADDWSVHEELRKLQEEQALRRLRDGQKAKPLPPYDPIKWGQIPQSWPPGTVTC